MKRLLVAALLVISCTHQTPEQKLVKQVSPSQSWLASLQFIGEVWLGNRVPTAYFRKSLASAEKELQKSSAAIEKADAASKLRGELRKPIDGAQSVIAAMKRAAETNDRAGIARDTVRCGALARELDQIAQQYEGSSQ
jgi:hypothetical protein